MHLVNSEWEWRVGCLGGIGECAWEQKGSKVRRMTVLTGVTNGGAVTFMRAVCLVAMGDLQGLLEFDAEGLVIMSRTPKAGFDKDFARFWAGSNLIVPGANGPGARP